MRLFFSCAAYVLHHALRAAEKINHPGICTRGWCDLLKFHS
jgi:hypothetical protein